MPASPDRILTTHVGSLVRPAELARYIEAIDEGASVDQGAFDRCLSAAVNAVVARQQTTGIDIVSDGEYGKFRSWSFYVLDRLAGIEERAIETPRGAGRDQQMFADFYAEYFPTQKLPKRGTVVCVGPLAYKGQAALQKDIAIFKAALKDATVSGAFLPVVAPASAVPRHTNEYYKDDEEFLFKLAEALREEYKTIIDAGLLVQIDDAFLPYMYDVAFAADDLAGYRKWAAVRIAALNHALEGLPAERIRYHICWGSFNTPHVTDVPLNDIVDLVLEVKAGAYCIEMANPRHEHEWRVWEKTKLPAGKMLIPGLISHATNVVEHPELVAQRLTRLAKLVGRENVMGGTDCGFAQTPHVRRVHPSIMWAKLAALAEGARLASAELWGRQAA
ncbi:MAG: cobalamin-independent methionine synthase II family protein [Hyphomicrobiales bacterium]|nr:cobalamin-independent methionine synthase II family protein [Hyphomicrobiales bacterium]MDE2372791.1 cobalamin-independent methionine synthase II family protein [Hyphomicrobiales bacterium]